jgi:polysaccharide pyruvyl transferase WcaK-like protein
MTNSPIVTDSSERLLDSGLLGAALAGIGRRGRRRTTVLLVGNYGNGNVGDEAILARLTELTAGRCDMVVVARQPELVKGMHGVAAVRTLSTASVRALLCTDVVAIGGGGIFGRGMPLLPRLLPAVAIAARILGKRIVYS